MTNDDIMAASDRATQIIRNLKLTRDKYKAAQDEGAAIVTRELFATFKKANKSPESALSLLLKMEEQAQIGVRTILLRVMVEHIVNTYSLASTKLRTQIRSDDKLHPPIDYDEVSEEVKALIGVMHSSLATLCIFERSLEMGLEPFADNNLIFVPILMSLGGLIDPETFGFEGADFDFVNKSVTIKDWKE